MYVCCVHFFLLLTLSTRSASNVTCFDETKTVYFIDTSVPVDDLPPVTTLIGGWESATISMYITKILLEEKMGVEVLLWPTASEDYSEWYAEHDDRYPVTQYEWLNNRSIDYIIEGWELTRPNENVEKLFALQNIKEIGNLGTVGQMFIFIPEYTIREHTTIGWFESLHDQEVIDIFLHDSIAIFDKYKGEKEFSRFYKWSKGAEDRFALVYADNNTVQTRPFIFGFKHSYQMSMDLWDRMHMLGLNNTWDLWFVESEVELTILMNEMFAKNMNFIAHLYAPTYHMGAYNWEKLNFPFPREVSCYEEKTCEEKLDVLFKTVNVQAMVEFPEVATFLSRVRLSNIDVNYMITLSTRNETATVWDSVCKWLEGNEAVWKDWIVPIQRRLLGLNRNVVIAIWFATALITSLTLLALKYLIKYKEKPLIRAVSPSFLALAAVSGILVAFAGALWTLNDYEYGLPICIARWIFACTGNTVIFTSMSLKTWRAWKIFKSANLRHIETNCELYRDIIIVYIPVAGILIWRTIESYEKGLLLEISEDGVEYQYQCPDTLAGIYLTLCQWIIAFVALFFCLKARDIPDNLNENVHIMYLCIFTMLLMGFGVVVYQTAGNTPNLRAIIVSLCHLMAAVVIEITVLGRTMYLLIRGKAGRRACSEIQGLAARSKSGGCRARSEIEINKMGITHY